MTTITSIRKVADFVPGGGCNSTLYAAALLPTGELCATGGHIDARQPEPSALSDRDRFADSQYIAKPLISPPVLWRQPMQAIDKRTFSWMGDEEFLQRRPESFVGSTAGASFIQVGEEMHCFFSASVNDRNIACGEHGEPNIHGSTVDPWSYFAIFHAVRRGGVWKLVNHARPNGNEALHWSAIYYEPTPQEQTGGFKALAMTHGIVEHEGWYYLVAEMWTVAIAQRNVLLRTRDLYEWAVYRSLGTDPTDAWSWPRLVSSDQPQGRLAQWINDTKEGEIHPNQISHMARTTRHPGYAFIALLQWSGVVMPGGSGMNNAIALSRANHPAGPWTQPEVIQCAIAPGVLDGTGASNTCLNPHYDDRDGSILFATSDFNLDGQPDCPGGPYQGRAIARAEVDGQVADWVNGGHPRAVRT